jgi:hypothetical protein
MIFSLHGLENKKIQNESQNQKVFKRWAVFLDQKQNLRHGATIRAKLGTVAMQPRHQPKILHSTCFGSFTRFSRCSFEIFVSALISLLLRIQLSDFLLGKILCCLRLQMSDLSTHQKLSMKLPRKINDESEPRCRLCLPMRNI